MFEAFLLFVGALVFSEGVGYAVHRLAHWPKTGPLFRGHMVHHVKNYPPSGFISEKYIGDLRTSLAPWFVPVFLLLGSLAWWLLPWRMHLPVLGAMTISAVLNNVLHDSYHVKDHWLVRFRWHKRLVEMHRTHHENVRKNLGIYVFWYDRLVGSIRKIDVTSPSTFS